MRLQFRKPHIPQSVLLVGTTILIMAAIMAIPGIYYFRQYQSTQFMLNHPDEYTKAENKKLLVLVAKLVELPNGEEPQVATVLDPEKLKNESFFQRAQAGDKVLFYAKTKRAYLYRPTTNKIIDIAPVSGATETPVPPAIAP